MHEVDPILLNQHRMLKFDLEKINNEIKEATKKVQELEKANIELNAYIDSKRAKEDRAVKQSELIKSAKAKLDHLRKTSMSKEDYFNREVDDHHNCFQCDF